jgi:hypothetical protein
MQPSLKLSRQFDAARLQSDLNQILAAEYVPHFNTHYYEGGWSVAPLRSIGGGASQIYPDPTQPDAFEDTPLLARCPYVREVLRSFQSPLRAVRFLRLAAGSVIKEHRDYKLSLEEEDARLHIPVVTNPEVEFFLKGERVIMNEGECWYLNLSEPHRVANRGPTDRVHLVVDLAVNGWFRDWVMAEAASASNHAADHKIPILSQTTNPKPSDMPAEYKRPMVVPGCPPEPKAKQADQATLVNTIVEFLRGIGLEVEEGKVDGTTFVPGIQICHGSLIFDPALMEHPGDLLHEAGHLALKTPMERRSTHLTSGDDPGEEMAAIAWSYAAGVHLELPPAVVFHADGYRGASSTLIDNFTQGHFIGVPILQWRGLTCDQRGASQRGAAPYPAMLRWLREA